MKKIERYGPFRFTGKGGDYFRLALKNLVLMLLTLGFYYPWANTAIKRYFYTQTYLGGIAFGFSGKGGSMFIYFIRALLVVLMGILIGMGWAKHGYFYAGIFGCMAWVALMVPYVIHNSLCYKLTHTTWGNVGFKYHGHLRDLFSLYIHHLCLTMLTMGIYLPWFIHHLRAYIINHISLGTARLGYDGKAGNYTRLFWSVWLYTSLSLGLYCFRGLNLLRQYFWAHVFVAQNGQTLRFEARTTAADWWQLNIVNLLTVVPSLVLMPWAHVRNLRKSLSKLYLRGNLNLATIQPLNEQELPTKQQSAPINVIISSN